MRLSGPFTSALLLAALLAAQGPARATAQQGGSVLDAPRLAPVRDRIAARVEQAREASLPHGWLTDKAAEGLAKHVPPPMIAGAVDGLWERMGEASELLAHIRPQWRTDRELLRGAVDAMAVGAPGSKLRALGQAVVENHRRPARPRRAMRETLVAIAEIGERGFSGELAARTVGRAYARHRLPGVASLVRAVREIPRGASLSSRRRALRRAAERRPQAPGNARGHASPHPGGPSSDDSSSQGKRRKAERPDPPSKGSP